MIGGGVVGCSIAYHLARRGMRDVVLLERETVGCGTTSKAAGGIRAQFSTETEIRFSQESQRVFETFKDEFGVDPGYQRIGYLFLISTPRTSRLRDAHRAAAPVRSRCSGDCAQGGAGHRPRAPGGRPHRRGVGADRRPRRPRRDHPGFRPARPGARRPDRGRRRRDGAGGRGRAPPPRRHVRRRIDTPLAINAAGPSGRASAGSQASTCRSCRAAGTSSSPSRSPPSPAPCR